MGVYPDHANLLLRAAPRRTNGRAVISTQNKREVFACGRGHCAYAPRRRMMQSIYFNFGCDPAFQQWALPLPSSFTSYPSSSSFCRCGSGSRGPPHRGGCRRGLSNAVMSICMELSCLSTASTRAKDLRYILVYLCTTSFTRSVIPYIHRVHTSALDDLLHQIRSIAIANLTII